MRAEGLFLKSVVQLFGERDQIGAKKDKHDFSRERASEREEDETDSNRHSQHREMVMSKKILPSLVRICGQVVHEDQPMVAKPEHSSKERKITIQDKARSLRNEEPTEQESYEAQSDKASKHDAADPHLFNDVVVERLELVVFLFASTLERYDTLKIGGNRFSGLSCCIGQARGDDSLLNFKLILLLDEMI